MGSALLSVVVPYDNTVIAHCRDFDFDCLQLGLGICSVCISFHSAYRKRFIYHRVEFFVRAARDIEKAPSTRAGYNQKPIIMPVECFVALTNVRAKTDPRHVGMSKTIIDCVAFTLTVQPLLLASTNFGIKKQFSKLDDTARTWPRSRPNGSM